MPLDTTRMVFRGLLKHEDVKQYADLLTGAMADQPVTLGNTLTLGGDVMFSPDAVHDIGLYNASRPQSIYAGSSVYVGDNRRIALESDTLSMLFDMTLTSQTGPIRLKSGSAIWRVENTGQLSANVDNAYDIGAAAASRPRDLFLGRNLAVGGTLGVTGVTTLGNNLLFGTDNAFDIGASGFNRPRNLFLGGNLTVTGTISGPGSVPAGGTSGQALIKSSATNYDITWGAAGMSQATADARYLQLAGGALTGPLTLAADPAVALGASTKQYVDTQVGGRLTQAQGDARYLQLSGGTISGTLGITSNGSVNGKWTMLGTNANTIAGAAGGTLPVEVQSPGGGAAAIAFHRPGFYAAHFGLDTDNVWKVGGWSMGAVAYTIWHSGNMTFSPTSFGANYGVQRDASGYIRTAYINTSADAAAGKPAYVAGQNGDGFLRWYSPAAIGPPSGGWLMRSGSLSSGGADVGTGGRFLNVGDSGGSAIVSYVGDTRVIINKDGYWFIYMMSETTSPVWSDGKYLSSRIYLNGGANNYRYYSDSCLPNSGGYCRSVATIYGFLGNGTTIQFFAIHGAGGWSVVVNPQSVWELHFIPTAEYPN